MTVIAWDGKTLAADGQVNCGDIIVTKSAKKIFEGDELKELSVYGQKVLAAGFSGDFGCEKVLLDYENKDVTHLTSFTASCEMYAILVCQNTTFELFKPQGQTQATISESVGVSAVGSGSQPALVLMLAGRDSISTVSHLTTMLSSCGGVVLSWSKPCED